MVLAGVIPAGTLSIDVDNRLRTIPLTTPPCDAPHPFTCRIWLREVVRVLDGQHMVKCRSTVDALEKELTMLADENGNSVALGRPWKLHDDVDSVLL